MSEADVIIIPTFPASPPTTSSKAMSTSPEWFTTPVKAPYKPSPLSISLPITALADLVSQSRRGSSDDEFLSSEPSTPPLSPTSPLSSLNMSRHGSGCSTSSSGSDGDSEDVLVTPLPKRTSGRSASSASYFDLQSSISNKNSHRSKVPAPTELFTPNWRLDERPSAKVFKKASGKLLAPFELSQSTKASEYFLDEDSFVLTHVPTRSASITAFKPRLPRVPRWQRPLVIAVMSVLLFGSLCMVSWFQQSIINTEHAIALRQSEWMVKHSAMAKAESAETVDTEPGFRHASPNHHSLKVQAKLAKRVESGQTPLQKVDLHMSKDEELAALMNFIVGTAANELPEIDLEDSTSLEGFLPFNPRSRHAKAELAELVRTQWEDHPVMVLGNMRDSKMRETRSILKKYTIKPAPFYVDIDQRSDSAYLSAVLEHLLGKQDGPYVLLAGKNIGSSEKLAEFEKQETLVDVVSKAGARIARKLKRNKHQREEERKENERVLGPKPILMG